MTKEYPLSNETKLKLLSAFQVAFAEGKKEQAQRESMEKNLEMVQNKTS